VCSSWPRSSVPPARARPPSGIRSGEGIAGHQSIAAAERLGCPRLNRHGTGLDPKGLPVRPVQEVTGAMWLAAARTLERVAALGERAG
jgi:hydroxypyruvate isomerase